MSVVAKTRDDTTSMTRKNKFLSKYEGADVQKNFDEIVPPVPQSRKTEEGLGEMKGKKFYGNINGWRSASCLANSSTVSLPGRNE